MDDSRRLSESRPTTAVEPQSGTNTCPIGGWGLRWWVERTDGSTTLTRAVGLHQSELGSLDTSLGGDTNGGWVALATAPADPGGAKPKPEDDPTLGDCSWFDPDVGTLNS